MNGLARAKNSLQCLVASRASFLHFLVAQNKIKWPWISPCTYMNVPLADFIRVLT